MASPIQIFRSCLKDLGLVQYLGVRGSLPVCIVGGTSDEIDIGVFILGSTGRVFGRRARDGKNLVHPGFKVIVRHTNYQTGYDLANSIAVAMDQRTFPIKTTLPTSEGGSTYYIQNIIRTTEVVDLGEETGKKRQLWSINGRIAFEDEVSSIG